MPKLLKKVYKTYEGARKRAAFENGISLCEYDLGYKAHLYRYVVVEEGSTWRVQRLTSEIESAYPL